MSCSLLIFSDWLISLIYERLKESVPWGLSVVIAREPGYQQLGRGSCIHTLCTHIGTILKQYWVGTWV